MIRRMQSGNSGHSRNMPVDVPSPEQIKRLTAEIRERWSPKTRAGRAAAKLKTDGRFFGKGGCHVT